MSGNGEEMDVTEMTHDEGSSKAVGPRLAVRRAAGDGVVEVERETVFDIRDVSVSYGTFRAVRDLTLPIAGNEITALIGPSGCGKTTFLRCLNRMNDLIEGARVEGTILYHGVDLYDEQVDPVEVRRRIGMVFQKPNPFPKSIYDNVAFGPRIAGYKGNMDELVEESLRRAALWDEVSGKL
jgi:phosphate transport system ATP-binding protein